MGWGVCGRREGKGRKGRRKEKEGVAGSRLVELASCTRRTRVLGAEAWAAAKPQLFHV